MARSIAMMALCMFALARPTAAAEPTGPFLIKPGQRVLILGDSITHGGTYVSIFEAYLYANFPKASFDVIAVGLSSETASGLSEKDHPFPRPDVHTRLDSALEKVKPQVVIACYGMNDGIYHPQSPERMDAYKKGIEKLIAKSKASGAQMVMILTPPPFDPTGQRNLQPADGSNFSYKRPYAKYDDVLADYAKWIMQIKKPGVVTADIHTALSKHLADKRKTDANYRVSGDGIHPNAQGHLIMAAAMIKGLKGSKAVRTSADDLKSLLKSDFFRLVDKRRKLLSDAWRSHIGHKRPGVRKGLPIDQAKVQAAELDKQIRKVKAASP